MAPPLAMTKFNVHVISIIMGTLFEGSKTNTINVKKETNHPGLAVFFFQVQAGVILSFEACPKLNNSKKKTCCFQIN